MTVFFIFSSTKQVVIAICGVGRAGTIHLFNALHNHLIKVKYLVDLDVKKVMEMKKEYFLEEIIIVHADEFDKVLSIDSTNINFSKVSSKVTRTHCVKSVRIRSFPGWYFPTFGLNTDQKNFEYERFSRSNNFQSLLLILNQSN